MSAPGGRAFGGNGLGVCGCGWGWCGCSTSRPPCPLLLLRLSPARRAGPARDLSPRSAACRGPQCGRPRRWRGSPGPGSQPLVHPPRPCLRPRQLPAMRPGPAPGLPPVPAARRGPRSGPRHGLLGMRSQPPVRLGPPPGAGRQGLLLGRRGRSPRPSQAPGSPARCRRGPPRSCPAGSLASTAASASLRSSRSAGVSPSHSGETGEQEWDGRWWRSSRWGEPSESDITVILVGMHGGRCTLPTTSRCICIVPWAVLCSALGEGGGGPVVASAPYGRVLVAIHQH